MSATEFGKALKRHRPNVQKVKRGAKSKQQWCYVGMRLKP